MCQVVRVQDLLESMEDLLDRQDPANGPARNSATLDDVLAPEEWSDDTDRSTGGWFAARATPRRRAKAG